MATVDEVRRLYEDKIPPNIPRWGSFSREFVGTLLAAVDAERKRADEAEAEAAALREKWLVQLARLEQGHQREQEVVT